MKASIFGKVGALLLLSAAATIAHAAQEKREDDKQESKLSQTGKKAGDIASQPARDVGVVKTEIPPLLEEASKDPYDLNGLKTCKQIIAAVVDLNEVIGPDFIASDDENADRAGKLAEAGGRTVVNSLIPFRGLVREISGAASAQRRLEAAVSAGYARRGFLRGVLRTRGCKTPF